jgi:C-terminal processing protease CtpA/Prc
MVSNLKIHDNSMKSFEKTKINNNKQVMMSFVDKLWSMEISGGFESSPLTVIAVKKNGLAKRAGIKVGDIILYINNISTDKMTLNDAQLEIQESGKSLKLTVKR